MRGGVHLLKITSEYKHCGAEPSDVGDGHRSFMQWLSQLKANHTTGKQGNKIQCSYLGALPRIIMRILVYSSLLEKKSTNCNLLM